MDDCSICGGSGEICTSCDEDANLCVCDDPKLKECYECDGTGVDPLSDEDN